MENGTLKIIVEVGNPEQKALIKEELSSLERITGQFESPLSLNQIIVASDFDKTVNELQKTNSYKSVREKHSVSAKVLQVNDEAIMVLSPRLYTAEEDFQSRMLTYLHEIIHIHNWQTFPAFCDWSNIPIEYSQNLYTFFDEYYADRKAFEIMDKLFKRKTKIYLNRIETTVEGHLQTVIDDFKSYSLIKREIDSFRQHADVERFLGAIYETFDGVSKEIIHVYAYLDHFSRFSKRKVELQSLRFVNDKTVSLIEFIRSKYVQNSFDLMDGMTLIESFLTNFGMRFEILPSGEVYCHVLEI